MSHSQKTRLNLRLNSIHLNGEVSIATSRGCSRCNEIDEDCADHANIWNKSKDATTHLSKLGKKYTIKRIAKAEGGEIPLISHLDTGQSCDRTTGARLHCLSTISKKGCYDIATCHLWTVGDDHHLAHCCLNIGHSIWDDSCKSSLEFCLSSRIHLCRLHDSLCSSTERDKCEAVILRHHCCSRVDCVIDEVHASKE